MPAERPILEKRIVRFGPFELDLRAGELRRDGKRIKLQEQPFQILSMLLEARGEVVTREELQQKLWPADTFVDFDHGLNAAIRKVRTALGDSADHPQFIETLGRRGYRFLSRVQQPVQVFPYIQWANAKGDLETFWLVALEVSIGRKSDCDIVIPNQYVSRHHAKLVRSEETYSIHDLGSSHGTFVNGTRIATHELQSGDRFALGRDRVELVYYTDEGETAGKSDLETA